MFILSRATIIFFLFTTYGFANDQISVEVSDTEIILGESFLYSITFDNQLVGGQEVSIGIPGNEAFQVFSESQGSSYENINGVTKGSIEYRLDLSPKSIGVFSLGPVKILTGSGEIIDDEIITISVSELSKINIPQNEDKSIQDNEGGLGDLKGMRSVTFPWGIVIGVLIIGVLSGYIIFLQRKEPGISKEQQKNNRHDAYIIKMNHYFKQLGETSEDLETQDFFKKYNVGVREIFSHAGIPNAHKITLSELSKLEHLETTGILTIFKKSYKHEYSGTEVSQETRKKYIIDILGELNK